MEQINCSCSRHPRGRPQARSIDGSSNGDNICCADMQLFVDCFHTGSNGKTYPSRTELRLSQWDIATFGQIFRSSNALLNRFSSVVPCVTEFNYHEETYHSLLSELNGQHDRMKDGIAYERSQQKCELNEHSPSGIETKTRTSRTWYGRVVRFSDQETVQYETQAQSTEIFDGTRQTNPRQNTRDDNGWWYWKDCSLAEWTSSAMGFVIFTIFSLKIKAD